MTVELSVLLLKTVFSLLLLAMLARLLLQLSGADYFNPVAQLAVRASEPLLRPLALILPNIGRLNLAALAMAFALQTLAILALMTISGMGPPYEPLAIATWAALGLANFVLDIYFFSLLITVIASWIAPQNAHPALMLLLQLLAPIQRVCRRILPATGGLDFSPIAIFLLITALQIMLRHLAERSGLVPGAVIGF